MKLRGLYAITDSQLLAGKFLSYVEAALEGGVTLLQYRDKSSDEARRLREAEALRDLCERYKTQLIINDDAELAARLNVGVHLGQTDGPLSPTRALLGSKAIIGSTCHAQLELAEQAAKEGASYVAFGRFFNSNTKPGAPTCSLDLLDQARKQSAPADLRDRRHHPGQRRPAGGPWGRSAGRGAWPVWRREHG